MDFFVAQVQVAVFQPHLFLHFGGGGHLKGQHIFALAQHGKLSGPDFHGAGFDFGVDGVFIPLHHRPAGGDHTLPVDLLQHGFVVDDHLHHAVLVPHIQKDDAAVVPNIFYPAGYPRHAADVLFPDVVAAVGAVDVWLYHAISFLSWAGKLPLPAGSLYWQGVSGKPFPSEDTCNQVISIPKIPINFPWFSPIAKWLAGSLASQRGNHTHWPDNEYTIIWAKNQSFCRKKPFCPYISTNLG